MTNIDINSKVRLFTLANSLTEKALDQLEANLDLNLCRAEVTKTEEKDYYAQFEANFRKEAQAMGKHYEVFYCLEKSIRSLIIELMVEKFSANWWNEKVREDIKKNVSDNMAKDADSGYTQRSEEKIDYTTFGELSEIVTSNWEAFEDLFKSKRAFQKIMASLNLLRGPIAHCCPLAEDEIVRLDITVKDWFRLMD
ncbi:MAG: Swt1 family HEPN domain-containing protein [Patescibacteria group bacterium]|jgi:hypothetical protein